MSQPFLRYETEVLDLRPAHPFVIARGGRKDFRTIWVRLITADGAEGWGEAAPNPYYGETPETVLAALPVYTDMLRAPPTIPDRREAAGHAAALPVHADALDATERAWEACLPGHASARAALSLALHDLAGKHLGVPLHGLIGADPGRVPCSSFTIGIDAPDVMRAKVRDAAAYPILKVKLGTERDLEIVRTIRDATDKELRVDANAAWTASEALAMLPALVDAGVTVLEQPVAAGDLAGLAEVRRHASIPIVADESCRTSADVPGLVGAVDAINIKLAKCGGIREALRMISMARAGGLGVMLGCMIESSLGITAAAHLAPLADIVDLDGAALLANDPFVGATMDAGRLTLPTAPGLGVRRR